MQFGKASLSVGQAIMKVFLSSGTQPVRLQAGSWRASAMLDRFLKAYTILQRKDIWAIRFWKLNIFFSFLIFSFFLVIG